MIEGFRPGVMERLGLGPDVVQPLNPRIVYGRMTGWGQTGPLAQAAGHDLNYIAITGALHAIGVSEKPVPPLNLLGDLGGGALYLAFGLLAAIIHARETGQGQVVDCAISDGVASLMAGVYGLHAAGEWTNERRANLLDGGAHFYDTYRCRDGKWVSIAALEPQFYALLLQEVGLTGPDLERQRDKSTWPEVRNKLQEVLARRTRDEWTGSLEGRDTCFAPVLDLNEAPQHPHNLARETFLEVDGVVQPAPAPRFSLTPGSIQGPAPAIGEHNESALQDWGFTQSELAELRASGALD
jgi:alpha-methylacyl-CoA racemase